MLYLLKHLWNFISLCLKRERWIPTSQSGSRCLSELWAITECYYPLLFLPPPSGTIRRNHPKSVCPHISINIDIFLSLSHSYSDHICEGKQGHKDFSLNWWEYKEGIYIAWPTEDSTMTKLFLKSMTVGCFYFVLHLLPSLGKSSHPVT